MKTISRLSPLVIGLIMASVLSAQNFGERDTVPVKNWDAPMYWQPSLEDSKAAAVKQMLAGNSSEDRASSITAQAQTPANSLVFVGMTPCRVVDTRGATGPFGGPSLIGGTSRTFPIQSSATCSIPSMAQAYSFNITVVPPGFLDFITVWPTGQARPLASTLNGYVNTVIANAAIAPAGTNGSVDVFASQNTHLIIDINGYYAAQSGITLTQGTVGAPSLSFAGDPATGIFSSAAGTVNIATGRLEVQGSGDPLLVLNHTGSASNPALWFAQDGTAKAYIWWDQAMSRLNLGTPTYNPIITLTDDGNVSIGTSGPIAAKLHVEGSGTGNGVYAISSSGNGVVGVTSASQSNGVVGISSDGTGVSGYSTSGFGVYGSSSGWAGYFQGNVRVTGTVTQNSDARLKQEVASLGYGLRELMRLRPVTWNWKDRPDGGRQLGLIAQEVETVLPDLVSTDKSADQTKGLNYIGLVPVTIKAIQEQQAQIEAQEKRNADQQERITEQKEQLEEQRRQIDGLKLLVCLDHPEAAVCK